LSSTTAQIYSLLPHHGWHEAGHSKSTFISTFVSAICPRSEPLRQVFKAVSSLTLARLLSSQKHPSKVLANITDRGALASAIYVKFADCKMLYKHSHLGTATNMASMPNQKENNEYISWSKVYRFDAIFKPRELRAYDAGADFIQIWNLLSKRTTSYPEDVLTIFAALLHRSGGEILDIKSHIRTRAIMRSVECLPLDILCVQQKTQHNQTPNQTRYWMPEFPRSTFPVPLFNSRWGTLKRVTSGFIVDFNNPESTATRAIVCPTSLLASSQCLLRDLHSMETFLIQVDRPPSASKAKVNNVAQESRHLFLLSKEHPRIAFMNQGVLCTIIADTGDTLRVRIDIKIGWSSKADDLSKDSAVDCFVADSSSPILIEMSKLQSLVITSAILDHEINTDL